MTTITPENSETDQIVLDALEQLSSETGETVEAIWENGYTSKMNDVEVLAFVITFIHENAEDNEGPFYWGGNPVL